jgi:hypothetical protein
MLRNKENLQKRAALKSHVRMLKQIQHVENVNLLAEMKYVSYIYESIIQALLRIALN